MGNIFDLDESKSKKFTKDAEPEDAPKRSKHREALSSSEAATGKRRLYEMVEEAFNTLQSAMSLADWPTAIKAAQTVLDRAGFGPKSTLDINTLNVDLSSLTREQLADRATKLAETLRNRIPPPAPVEVPQVPGIQ